MRRKHHVKKDACDLKVLNNVKDFIARVKKSMSSLENCSKAQLKDEINKLGLANIYDLTSSICEVPRSSIIRYHSFLKYREEDLNKIDERIESLETELMETKKNLRAIAIWAKQKFNDDGTFPKKIVSSKSISKLEKKAVSISRAIAKNVLNSSFLANNKIIVTTPEKNYVKILSKPVEEIKTPPIEAEDESKSEIISYGPGPKPKTVSEVVKSSLTPITHIKNKNLALTSITPVKNNKLSHKPNILNKNNKATHMPNILNKNNKPSPTPIILNKINKPTSTPSPIPLIKNNKSSLNPISIYIKRKTIVPVTQIKSEPVVIEGTTLKTENETPSKSTNEVIKFTPKPIIVKKDNVVNTTKEVNKYDEDMEIDFNDRDSDSDTSSNYSSFSNTNQTHSSTPFQPASEMGLFGSIPPEIHVTNDGRKIYESEYEIKTYCGEYYKTSYLTCVTCKKTFDLRKIRRNPTNLRTNTGPYQVVINHINAVHRDKFACNQCEKSFRNFAILESHKNNNHQLITECEICGRPPSRTKTAATRHLWSHKSAEEREEAIKNGEPDPFFNKKAMKHQKLIEKNNGVHPYECSICHDRLLSKKGLEHHSVVHKNKDKTPAPITLLCPDCGMNFRSKNGYKLHISKIHSPEKIHMYICKYCDKRYYTRGTLNDHLRTHTGDKPFPCSICSRSFNSKVRAKTHEKTCLKKGKKISKTEKQTPSTSKIESKMEVEYEHEIENGKDEVQKNIDQDENDDETSKNADDLDDEFLKELYSLDKTSPNYFAL